MSKKAILFWWGGLSFIGGVGYGSFFAVDTSVLALVFSALALVFGFSFSRPVGIFSLSLFGCFLFGAWYASDARMSFAQSRLPVGEVSGEARVVSDPEEKSFYQEVVLRMESCEGGLCPKQKILWQAPRSRDIRTGERYRFLCSLELPKNFSDDFDYRMFLAKEGIGYACKKATIETLPGDLRTKLGGWLLAPKHALERALGESVSQPEAGLAAGLLVGGDDRLPTSLREAFTRIGLTHIVAVSGYNIALIASGLVWCCIALGLWRRHAVLVSAVGIALFVLMIGAPASAVRAGLMAFIAFSVFQFGRFSGSFRALLLVAVLMLLFEPLLLRYDAGFQLSFLATFAIVFAASWEPLVFPKDFPGKGLAEIAFFTFVVELFVLPVILFSFHIFSPYALLANVLLLPLVPVAMGLSFAAALGTLFLPQALHVMFALPAWMVLASVTRAAEYLSELPGAGLTTESFGVWSMLSWYGVLGVVVWQVEKYRKRKTSYEEA